MGAITIYKEGEVLSSWNGSNFVYEKKKLQGATFKVTAGADIYKSDGTKVYSQGDLIAENLKTGSDGRVVLTDLHLGTYVVTETKSIDGYTINTTPQTIKIEYKDQTIEVQYEATTILNTRQKAEISVIKKDSDTSNPLIGGKYTLYAENDIKNYAGQVIVTKGTALQTVTTGADGKAAYTVDIPIANSYYISETQAPQGYVRNSADVYHFNFKYLSETTAKASFSHTFINDRTTAKIHIYKIDKETGVAVPQGDAKLSGAVYGLYARENIVHPDGATGVIFKTGDLVATLTTDASGNAEVKNLYLGNYYVKEIEPSEGYLLDEEAHDVVCNYEGDLVAEVSRSTTSKEQVKKQPFQLIKVSDNGDDTEAPLLKGAGFTAYLKSSLSVKEDGGYDYGKATPVIISEDGKTTIYTDEKGYAVSIPIPYGTYVVLETVTPHNMETIKPFEVKITENNPTKPQTWRVFLDREFTAKLRIVKKDADTGKTVLIPNTEFKIFNMDTKKYVSMITTYPSKVSHTTFSTDEDGDLILPENLKLGRYRIEEVAAPFGYVINSDYVYVEVDTDTFYEIDSDTYEAIITIDYVDAPTVGNLTIEKRGEVLSGYTGGLFSTTKDKQFEYKMGSLAGAKYKVYAAEDIFTADMQLDENGLRTKYYNEGDLITTIETGKDGKATLSDLPLGTYRIVEVEAPYGYVLNEEEQFVTFDYVDNKTPVIYEAITFCNDRQKLSMAVVKLDAEENTPIAGAVFGLFVREDIKNAEGKIIVEAGSLMEVVTSDENGMILFTKDYPFATYYAKEMKTPDGYVSSEEVITFETKYQGQNVKVAEYSSDFFNAPTTFEFTKEDITSGVELSGATLSVLDLKGNVIETWTSVAGRTHVIKRLVAGQTYILCEEFAPYGYLQATDIEFTVDDSADIQKVVIQDEVPTGAIVINKDGEFVTDANLVKGHWYDFVFRYFKKSLAGVTFEVYAAESVVSADGLNTIYYEKDALVATIVTDENGIASVYDLPFGKYYLVETATINGFVLDNTPIKADLSYVDQYTKVVFAGMDITNERQKVQISVTKRDSETGTVLEGAVFGLFAKEDIVSKDGKVIVKADTLIEKAVTGKDGKVTFLSDLPLGQYYVKELEAPKGYAKSDVIFDVDASYQSDNVDVIKIEAEFENKPIKVEFSKTDITGENELEGAVLSVIDSNGKLVEKWTSNGKPHMIERLPAGKYILREEIAPFGYTIATDVEFEVTETDDIQKVIMKDDVAVGKIIIQKKDSVSGKALAGAKFEIRDKAGNVIQTLITDKNGKAESKELAIGTFKNGMYVEAITYYVVEVEAPEGYILDEKVREVVFEYKDGKTAVIKQVLEISNVPTEPKLPQTGDNANPWVWIGVGMLSVICGLGVYFRKKEEKN